MNLLLDTHILLWWMMGDPRLSEPIRRKIAAPSQVIFISAATVWEIGTKQALGKLRLPGNLLQVVEDEGFRILAITGQHAELAARLPTHHRDPFDRMLAAQAKLENLVLVTRDAAIQRYEGYLACVAEVRVNHRLTAC